MSWIRSRTLFSQFLRVFLHTLPPDKTWPSKAFLFLNKTRRELPLKFSQGDDPNRSKIKYFVFYTEIIIILIIIIIMIKHKNVYIRFVKIHTERNN